jgi:transitional endoplasmic reticulum ATPase
MSRINLRDIEDIDIDDLSEDVDFCSDDRGEAPSPLVRQWILRTLARMDEAELQRAGERASMTGLIAAVGLLKSKAGRRGNGRGRRKVDLHAQLLDELKLSEDARPGAPPDLSRNVARVAALAGLSDMDGRVLMFAVLLHTDHFLYRAINLVGNCLNSVQLIRIVADLLVLPEREIQATLSPRGALSQSGLVKLDRTGSYEIRSKLEILSEDFAVEMLHPEMTPADLLRGVVTLGSSPELSLADYAHIGPSLAVLRPYLSKALATGRRGVNVLLHGAPGTGKSQLARVLAAELGSATFEITCENPDGDPIDGEQRLRAIGAVQCFFARQRAVLVFDEVEDVFNDSGGFIGRKSTAQTHKGWVNRMLENNHLPTFWLSNAADCLDPAFVRRFDMVLELRVPPRQQRERIIQSVCGDMLETRAVTRLAESEHLAPAVIARAAAVVSSIQGELPETGTGVAIELLVNQTLQAQGHPTLRKASPHAVVDFYDPALVCADANLDEVMQGLRRANSGRLCLYGPPGTGKTAYGRWLADQLQAPLHVKRASDLMSMYVGGSERAVAEAFAQAREDNAVLLVDEVDSFLQDRRGAQHSWESTMVNEMLTQMEAFPGIFVASTNLMDNLDPAALRRFDIKVKFGYLTAEQAWGLLLRYCESLGLPEPDVELKSRLARFTQLTPGDFALVARQHGFRPLESAQKVVAALGAECKLKSESKPPMGFI